MTLLVAALIVAGAVWWAAHAIVRELQAERSRAAETRAIQLLQAFAPAVAAAQGDPRAVLIWQPLALTARKVAARCADITVEIQRASVVSIRRSGTSQMIATRM